MMYDRTILQVLQTSVANAVAASSTPSLPVKYIDRVWEIPDDQKWLELVFIPNNRDDFWGDEQNYAGLFRMILHWPNDDQGAYPPMDALASIAGYFSKSQMLGNVQIVSGPDMGSTIAQGSENLYPCGVRYTCFRP